MQDDKWFLERVGFDIESKAPGGEWLKTRLPNKKYASWLIAALDIGYEFRDIQRKMPNVCISCEG